MMKSQPKRLSPPSTQSGFTIIESLLAILIVTALLIGIAPVITLSVATRLQARRVEQATQAARTYIDGVRSRKIDPPDHLRPLAEVQVDPNTGDKTFVPRIGAFSAIYAPGRGSANANCNAATYCRNQANLSLYCADFDGSGACENSSVSDLIVQAFRSTIADPGNPTVALDPTDDGSKGFLLGIRVYRAAAFNGEPEELLTTQDTGGKKVATNTAGTGSMRLPLVEMTTEVGGTTDSPYNGLCQRLGGCKQ